jgi:hypothetical protein
MNAAPKVAAGMGMNGCHDYECHRTAQQRARRIVFARAENRGGRNMVESRRAKRYYAAVVPPISASHQELPRYAIRCYAPL